MDTVAPAIKGRKGAVSTGRFNDDRLHETSRATQSRKYTQLLAFSRASTLPQHNSMARTFRADYSRGAVRRER